MMLPNDYGIEAHHLNLHINQEQFNNQVFTVIGHVSGVDPTTNKIKCVIPTWTNDDMTYMETGWIPLGTMKAGNQEGIQILPYGGATVTDLTGQANSTGNPKPQPEQVLVHILGQKKALYVVGVQTFNLQDVPPSGYQDKSGVAAQAGEWLFKHATGDYLYFSNQNAITLLSYTNPAPVLQPQDAPAELNQSITLGVNAIGANSNSNGDKPATVNSTLILLNTATSGQTNNANTNENITSETQGLASKSLNITADNTQGTGRYTITINSNDSDLTINIEGNNNTYNLNVADGVVNVVSETSNIQSNTVNLGTGTMQRILNHVFTQFFNNHVHSGVQSGSGTTGTPTIAADSDQESQNAYSS
jgi:hypothetical protein